ncbi:MAG: NAD(+)/NADH kinase [bacterium]|nr:NAD(+)/NADH kinase [bacterium]
MMKHRELQGPVGIVANVSKENAADAIREAMAALEERGMAWRLEQATAACIGRAEEGLPFPKLVRAVTWLMAIGGDGTILTTVRETAGCDIPLLGVNPGHSLGFMTDTLLEDLPATLDDICQNQVDIIERHTLRATMYGAKDQEVMELPPALNDVAFVHGAQARLIVLDVMVNGAFFTTYAADGLIIATATGSTGHSMSAGGPILFPSTEAMVLTPICPHTLTNRPIILPRGYQIDVRVGAPARDVYVSVDGQVVRPLGVEGRVVVELGTYRARFIHSKRRSFIDVLREKLHWRGDLRGVGKSGG